MPSNVGDEPPKKVRGRAATLRGDGLDADRLDQIESRAGLHPHPGSRVRPPAVARNTPRTQEGGSKELLSDLSRRTDSGGRQVGIGEWQHQSEDDPASITIIGRSPRLALPSVRRGTRPSAVRFCPPMSRRRPESLSSASRDCPQRFLVRSSSQVFGHDRAHEIRHAPA